jgi:single-strand DNA-binding protein
MSHPNINHVVLIGRLTHDPELRELPSGQSVCNLRLACNGFRRDAEGEYRERPNYFDVATFAGLAETVARYMRRGSLVAVAGRLEWREWETADRSRETLASGEHPRSGQQRRQSVSVVADTVQFLERPGARDGDQGAALPAEDGPDAEGERELVGAGTHEVDLVF